MAKHDESDFSKKHPADIKSDPVVKSEILRLVKDNKIPCAVAFEIAKKTNVIPRDVGIALDMMNIRLSKCQLGLFGYKPDKKIVKTVDEVNQDLKDAINSAVVDNCLSCEKIWHIASELNISKMTVSGACESLNIKIKPCQLGAF